MSERDDRVVDADEAPEPAASAADPEREPRDEDSTDASQRTLEDELVAHPHDALCKHVYGKKQNAMAHLEGILPSSVLKAVDLDGLELMPGTYVSEALRGRHTDLLYRIPRRASRGQSEEDPKREDVFVYVLHEHQRTVVEMMALRLLEYMVRIWRRWRDDHPDDDVLPPIVPIVLYHGERRWTAARSFTDLVDVSGAGDVLDLTTPDFAYGLVELRPAGAETFWGTPTGRLALYLFANIDDDDLERILRGAAELFDAVERRYGSREIRVFVLYICSASSREADEALEAVRSELKGRVTEETVATVAEQLIERGREAGRKEGRKEGQQSVLLKLLRGKFGPLRDDVRERIDEATEAQLDCMTERVLGAASIDEIFEGLPEE